VENPFTQHNKAIGAILSCQSHTPIDLILDAGSAQSPPIPDAGCAQPQLVGAGLAPPEATRVSICFKGRAGTCPHVERREMRVGTWLVAALCRGFVVATRRQLRRRKGYFTIPFLFQ